MAKGLASHYQARTHRQNSLVLMASTNVDQYRHTVRNAPCAFLTVHKVVENLDSNSYGATTADFAPDWTARDPITNVIIPNPQWSTRYKVAAGGVDLAEISSVPQVFGEDRYYAVWECDSLPGPVTAPTVNVDIAVNGEEVCTVTNIEKATRVQLVKVVDTNGVTLTTPPQPDDFNLTLDGNPVLSGVWNDVAPGTLTADETTMTGWQASGWSGADCASDGTVQAAPGEDVICTITNTAIPPELTLVKNITDTTDDTTQTNAFGPTLSGPSGNIPIAWAADDNTASETVVMTEIGTFSFSEVDPDTLGYETTGWSCDDGTSSAGNPNLYEHSVDLNLGDEVTCTITNTIVEPLLNVTKNIVDTTGDDVTTDDFGPTVIDPDGLPVTANWGVSGTTNTIGVTFSKIGVYTLAEVDPATLGYTTSGWTCTEPDRGQIAFSTDHDVLVDVQPGDEITCEITNTVIEPELTLVKNIVDTTGDTTQTDDFSPSVSGPNGAVPISWAANDTTTSTTVTLPAVGTYNIAEIDPATLGYSASGWSCDDGTSSAAGSFTHSITVDAGDDVTCTITNTVVEPQLTLVKVIDDDTGDTTQTDAFGPTITGPSGNIPIAWIADDITDSQTVTLTEVGDYDISENNALALGYTASGWSCDDGSSSTNENHTVSIGAGDDITCTITNTAIQPGLTLIKTIVDSTDDDAQTDDFGPAVTDSLGGSVTTDVNGVTIGWTADDNSASQTIELATGSYTITESTVPGYEPMAGLVPMLVVTLSPVP